MKRAAQLEQLAEGGDLVRNRSGLEIVQTSESQFHTQPSIIVAEPIVHFERQSGGSLRQNLVEVVSVDLDKLPFLHGRQWLLRLTGQVSQNADHKGYLPFFDRIADLDIVGDVDARRAYPAHLFL